VVESSVRWEEAVDMAIRLFRRDLDLLREYDKAKGENDRWASFS